MKTSKVIIDRCKVRLTTSNNGASWTVTDTNRSRRQTASVINTGKGKWNVRIDRQGEPYLYAANVCTSTPEAAYEYAIEFGVRYPQALEV